MSQNLVAGLPLSATNGSGGSTCSTFVSVCLLGTAQVQEGVVTVMFLRTHVSNAYWR